MTSATLRRAPGEGGPARSRPGPVRRLLLRASGTGLVVLVAALLLGGGAPQVVDGVVAAPATTRWLVPVADLGAHLAAAMAGGCLLCWALLPVDARRGLARAGTGWCVGWSAAAVLGALLVGAEDAGTSPVGLLSRTGAADVPGRPAVGLLATAGAAAVLAVVVRTGHGGLGLGLLPLVLLPSVLTGHAAAGPHPVPAQAALLVHVVAAVLWAGGLAAVVVHLRGGPAVARALPGYSRVALAASAAVVASGTAAAALHLRTAGDLTGTGWGRLVLLKAALLLVLLACGAAHRARTLPAAVAGAPGAFLSLARGELLVLVAALAVAAALVRTPG